MEIKSRITSKVLFSMETDSIKVCLEAAIKAKADLQGADLQGADLHGADLWGAYLQGADLQGADLQGADLQGADLHGANLRWADLRRADLRGAYLQGAYLRGANLDFSCFPLWCGSFNIKADMRLATQLAYHFCKINFENCPEAKEMQEKMKDLANKFHRVDECGKIK